MTFRKTAALTAALAACALAAPALAQPSAAPAAVEPTLSTQGFGPLRVGMTWSEAHAAMPSLAQGDTETFEECYLATTPRYPGLYVMFQEGRLTRVTATDDSRVSTVRGARVGMTEADIRRLVPTGLEQEGHAYQDPPAKYLTFWASDHRRGVRFEIGHDGRVAAIHGGDDSVTLVEGCA